MNDKDIDDLFRGIKSKEHRISRRFCAVMLVCYLGLSHANAARNMRNKSAWVKRWVVRYEEEGVDGLYDRPRSGRPPKAERSKIDIVISTYCAGASAAKEVQAIIMDRLRVEYSLTHVRRFMSDNGFSKIKTSKYQSTKAPVEDQVLWGNRIRRLIRRLTAEGYTIICLDEMFYSWSDANEGGSVWWYRGTRRFAKVIGRRIKQCVFGALASDGRQIFMTADKFTSENYVEFLNKIHHKFGKVLIIADRASQHTSGTVEDFLHEHPDMRMEYFPTACPEYNVVEAVWNILKKEVVRNSFYPTFEEMVYSVSKFMRTHRFSNLDMFKYISRKPLLVEDSQGIAAV